ncbi:hypothetical protein PY310_18840 [Pseudarthrobacter sp. H3Y2-7]|uniref:hypothetical protein n=1 Tax=Pseudarthrobacter naphthalenicus TaxID=3031328 RepID=UPI0023B13107|nr:hypothetical protein [Pseudarthrobacter sp. H3Y2-7]MDE8670640.1 hypothetical protein [Pseudarthrobacter sp. H3Y2-7]
MTATVSETPTLNAPVDVRFTTAGTPLAVRYDGRIWAVAAEPLHWFTRDSWWGDPANRAGRDRNVVDIEHWRLQVRLGSSTSSLRTFELRLDPLSDQWLLTGITDN